MFISEAHSSIEALFVSRTPLMQAASKGNLVLVKAMVEQYHADPLMVAPDGQNAFRLARDNGHYAVAEYLPSTNAGGIRRIKFRSRHLVRQIRVISRGLGSYLKVLLYDFPKFLLWTVPKETGLFIGRTLGDAEKMGRFLRFVFWTTPKFILWDIPKTFPDIAKWFWEVLTVHLPPFLYRSAIGFWNLLLMAGITIGHAIVGLVSTIHTAIMAVITFLRSASLQDIWNGFVTVLHALFVSLPVLVWDGLKAAVRGIDSFMCNIFGILWLFGQMLIAGIMFIPIILWNSLGEVGIWLGKVGREALLFINPNW
ncbi:hypothetical protein DL96DRAFT_1472092 [Flagelloscypha sp. PMI_526]|nr:hypothetical protein DL96DRAFT_1472092 [Flagelloscypha sp. PMI_526]